MSSAHRDAETNVNGKTSLPQHQTGKIDNSLSCSGDFKREVRATVFLSFLISRHFTHKFPPPGKASKEIFLCGTKPIWGP